jgi:hypothetical protein
MEHSEIMRYILRALNKDVEQSAAVYAILEERLWPRDSNVENWSAVRYARSLAHNEIRKHSDLVEAVPFPQ